MTAPPTEPALRAGEAARARIIDAAIRCLVREGVSGATMAAIATTGGVSKALLHYHYADRARLLAEVVARLASRLTAREQAAMVSANGSSTVDTLWKWLEGELASGELRVLLELGLLREPEVRAASVAAALRRRRVAARTVDQVFGQLGLTPRMPAALLGDANVAFIDGLAVGSVDPAIQARASFDVHWLALLGLGE